MEASGRGAVAYGLMRPHSRVFPQVNFGILTADAFLAGSALLFALPGMVVAAGLSTFLAAGVWLVVGDFRTGVWDGSRRGVTWGLSVHPEPVEGPPPHRHSRVGGNLNPIAPTKSRNANQIRPHVIPSAAEESKASIVLTLILCRS